MAESENEKPNVRFGIAVVRGETSRSGDRSKLLGAIGT
jgi:hypothetical protein